MAGKHYELYFDTLEKLIEARTSGLWELIRHGAEKGRAAEYVVSDVLKLALPGRYSLATGFIVASNGWQSKQLDIVIYDGQLNAPAFPTQSVGLFPIECVYGFMEVKSKLNTEELQSFIDTVIGVRRHRNKKSYLGVEFSPSLAPRSFLFALDGIRGPTLVQALRRKGKSPNFHVHGIFNLAHKYFVWQEPHKKPYEFHLVERKPLREFLEQLRKALDLLPMASANMSVYSEEVAETTTRVP